MMVIPELEEIKKLDNTELIQFFYHLLTLSAQVDKEIWDRRKATIGVCGGKASV
jgi:hypothetical protein